MRLLCWLLGHRKHEFEWENGSVTTSCSRCRKLLAWTIPARYRDMGEVGKVFAMQENYNQQTREMLDRRYGREVS